MGKALTAPLFVLLVVAFVGGWRGRGDRRRASAFGALGAVVALAFVSMPAVSALLAEPLERKASYPDGDALRDADVVAVLSSNVIYASDGTVLLDEASYARTATAARAFRASGARVFVVQGTLGGDDPALMVRTMAELAASLGVPRGMIRWESRSRNTREHPLQLTAVPDVTPDAVVAVVTSAWHMPRAVREYERYFARVVPVPAESIAAVRNGMWTDWLPQARGLVASTRVLHERIGSVWYALRAAVSPRSGLFQLQREGE